MAIASGMDREAWCRQNEIAINTFRKYEKLRENGALTESTENTGAATDPLAGTGYAEIPLREDAERRNSDTVKTSDRIPCDTRPHKNIPPENQGIILEVGKIRLHIYEGISEATISTVVKAVMGIA